MQFLIFSIIMTLAILFPKTMIIINLVLFVLLCLLFFNIIKLKKINNEIDELQSYNKPKYMKFKVFYSKELYNKYINDKNSIVVNDEYLYYFDNLIYNKDSNGVVDITKFDK